ncbi:MAG: phosphoribulokinase, partial [Rhodospirillales bacterium]
MSTKYPIISVTGSSGAGTSSVKDTFEQIFWREKVNAAFIDGDAFHKFDRADMKRVMAEEAERGNNHFSHFGPEANLFEELESIFRQFDETGTSRTRHYVHDEIEADWHGTPPGTFTDWQELPEDADLLFYEGLHGALVT